MANPVEIIPLLVVTLVLISAGGGDVASIEIAVDGERTIENVDDVYVVGGGSVTVPADSTVSGPVYVIGGDLTIRGAVDGDVVTLAGTLTVEEGARIDGELQTVAGEQQISEGAEIARRSNVPADLATERSPTEQAGFLVAQAVLLGLLAWFVARRNPALLDNVADAVTEHSLVSGTVGLLASVTVVALLVFMAITILLLPVSIVGILGGFLVVGYVYVVFGFILGRRLPVERPGRAAAAGVVLFVGGMEVLGRIPLVGDLAQLVLLLVGIGAILITYFGLREFEPVQLPE